MQENLSKSVLFEAKTLNNGVTYSLINGFLSEKQARKACVSVTLSKGHFDAHAYPEGLAHLFEHMLFSASANYPKADELDKHLFSCGGQVNAWTQDQSTNIQLNCEQSGFMQSFNILFDRLVNPIFTIKDIKRELVAIEAEFQSKKSDPLRRLISVQKATCHPSHPFSRFNSGNAGTLGNINPETLRSMLIEYHQHVITGNNLFISVGIGEKTDVKAFSHEIEQTLTLISSGSTSKTNQATHSKSSTNTIYNKEHLGKLILVEQENLPGQMLLTFFVNHTEFLQDEQANIFKQQHTANYLILSHILESKHTNSLFFHLTNMGFIEDLSCDFKTIDCVSDEFIVNTKLTNKGQKEYLSVIQTINKYIDFLRNSGIESWRFREKATQFSLANMLEKGKGLLETCIDTSQLMMSTKQFDAPENLIINQQASLSFDEKTLDNIFGQLKPQYSRVYLVVPHIDKNPTDISTTPHFNVKFAISDLSLPNRLPQQLPSTFEKPRQNPYMPTDTKILKQQLREDELVQFESACLDFKFYQNTGFNIPIGECYISISDPEMLISARKIAIKRIWLACLQENLDLKFFDSHLASLHHRVYAHKHGITMHLSGISQRQLYLALDLINEVTNYKASPKLLSKILERFKIKANQNQKLRPINHLFASLNNLYQSSDITNDEIQKETLLLSLDDVLKQQVAYFNRSFIECLLIGSWSKDQAFQFCHILNTRFSAERTFSKPALNKPKWQSDTHIHYEMKDLKDSVVIWHYIPLVNRSSVNK